MVRDVPDPRPALPSSARHAATKAGHIHHPQLPISLPLFPTEMAVCIEYILLISHRRLSYKLKMELINIFTSLVDW